EGHGAAGELCCENRPLSFAGASRRDMMICHATVRSTQWRPGHIRCEPVTGVLARYGSKPLGSRATAWPLSTAARPGDGGSLTPGSALPPNTRLPAVPRVCWWQTIHLVGQSP